MNSKSVIELFRMQLKISSLIFLTPHVSHNSLYSVGKFLLLTEYSMITNLK